MNYKNIVVLIILIFGIENIKSQTSLDSIINLHLKAIGFSSSDEVKNFIIKGEVMQKNFSFPLQLEGIIPDKLRTDMTFNQVTFQSISNGTTKWEYNPVTDSIVMEKCENIEALNFLDRWCGALNRCNKEPASCKIMDLTTIDDIEVYKIEFKTEKSSQIYYLDKYSYLIVRIDDDYVENKITYYSDYRKTGKYYLPFVITGYESGIPVMSMKFSDVKVNTKISDSEFNKPK